MLTFSINKDPNSALSVLNIKHLKPTITEGREWLSEVYLKAVDGKIDEDIDVNTYGYICNQNTYMANVKKEVALITADEVNNGVKGVEDTVACCEDYDIYNIIDESDTKSVVDEFWDIHDYLLIEEGVDILKMIAVAIDDTNAYQEMAEIRLKNIVKEYSMYSLIELILTKPKGLGLIGLVNLK